MSDEDTSSEKIRILNRDAGIGGNRKLWDGNIEVTAVEIDPKIAAIYQRFFPNDKVIIGDAHPFLLEHFEGFDFIWSSPPCPSHSRIRNIAGVGRGQNKPIYPDMRLYEEIIFLNQVYHSSGTRFCGKWVVENVPSYYEPLIRPFEIGRHFVWANFHITPFKAKTRGHMLSIQELKTIKGFDVSDLLLLRNCTEPELGRHIFRCAFRRSRKHC